MYARNGVAPGASLFFKLLRRSLLVVIGLIGVILGFTNVLGQIGQISTSQVRNCLTGEVCVCLREWDDDETIQRVVVYIYPPNL